MIRQLSINNIAVIDTANIDFDKGFNLLTGETGAGKSIVIDSLNMLKGERTSKDIIRNGEKKASVHAVLDVNDEAAREIEEQTGIEVEDGELMISREINLDGKTISVSMVCPQPLLCSRLWEIYLSIFTVSTTTHLSLPKRPISDFWTDMHLRQFSLSRRNM